MALDELIDERVSAAQCKKAVDALLAHEEKVQAKKTENELLGGKEVNVWLVVTTKRMHPEAKLKPARIPLKHPLVDPRTSPVCLITKDPQREYKDLLEAKGIRFISRVVGITKLKGKFKSFEARRMLLQENGLFLADDRVVPLLPKLLGKPFFKAKKQPIPVSLTKKDIKGELERAISATYFHQNQGTCVSVKIGTLAHSPAQVLDNLAAALPAVARHVKGGWDNLQAFHVKTGASASLPLWTCELGAGAGARWDGLVAGAEESEDEDEDEDEAAEDEAEEEEPAPVESKKRKRAGKEPEEGESKSKKAKGKAPAAPEPAPAPKASGKNKRAAKEELEAPKKKAKLAEASEKVPVDAGAASKAKGDAEPKKGKSAAPTPAPAPAPAPVEEAPAPKEKRRSKRVAAAAEEAEAKTAPQAAAKPASSAGEKPKSKAKPPPKAAAASGAAPAAASPPKSILKKGKAAADPAPSKKAAKAQAAVPAAEPSVGAGEVRKKRAGEGLARKKVKIAEGTPGAKPAKAAVLGRRRA